MTWEQLYVAIHSLRHSMSSQITVRFQINASHTFNVHQGPVKETKMD